MYYTKYTPLLIYRLIQKIQFLAGFVIVTIALGATDTELSTETSESAKQTSTKADEKKVDSDNTTEAEIPLNEELFIMNDFEVTAEQDRGYYSSHSLAATRTNAAVKDTPVTITVVNKELMEDLDLSRVNDISKVVASAAMDSSGGDKVIRFRGFRTNFQLFEFMPRQSPQNYYNIERADIIRGSNSLIYGQSAPGGKVNFNAKRASFGRDSRNFSTSVSDKDLLRFSFDGNKVINDTFAVRIMAIDEAQEFAQRYRKKEHTGATIEATYRLSSNTEFRLHYERSNTFANSVSGTYQDGTTSAGLSGIFTDLPSTSEVVRYLSPDAVNYILSYDQKKYSQNPKPRWATNPSTFELQAWFDPESQVRTSLIDFQTKQDILDFYEGISTSNSGSIAYSDAGSEGQNEYILSDMTHRFSDKLQYKFSIMHENVQNNGQRPESGNKLMASIPFGATNPGDEEIGGPNATPNQRLFIAPYWVTTDGNDRSTALRNTLSWQFENDSWKFLPASKQQLLVGIDYDRRNNNVLNRQMYYADADPSNLDEQDQFTDWRPRYDWADRGVDYYPLGYTGRNPFDFITNSYTNLPNGVLPDGYRDNEPLALRDRSERLGHTEVYAAWFALQGKYFNDRLNTLTGLRYDNMYVESEYSAYSQEAPEYQNDGRSYYYVNPSQRYHKYSPSLGGLFWLNSNLAVFANYSKSIESPTGWELQPDGKDIPPQTGEGLEYGIKFELLDGKITGQALAFNVEKKNDSTKYDGPVLKAWASEYAPHLLETIIKTEDAQGRQEIEVRLNKAGNHIADTIVKNTGFETDLYYNPSKNLSLFLGYAYLDAEIQNSPKLDGSETGIIDGDPYAGFAHHNAVFTARYNFSDGFLKGWYAGLSERFTSESFLGVFYEDVGWADGKNPFQNSTTYYDGLPDVIAVIEYDEAASRTNDLNNNGKVDRNELITKTDTNGNVIKTEPKSHEVWLSDHFNTTVFLGWRGKLFGKGRSAPTFNFHFAVDNLLNAVDLVARGRNAAFTESRTFSLRASVNF
jgi:outer membrane receptor protein involved in Fe transport